MVTVSHIPKPTIRFISRERLEQIKSRIQRIPFGKYKRLNDDLVFCSVFDEKGKWLKDLQILKVLFPGAIDFFLNAKKDMEDLVQHVEEADKENDFLIAKIKELESVKTSGD